MGERYFEAPEEVEAAYYEAFHQADVNAMMEVWADDPGITCVHPARGAQLRGPAQVLEGWLHVFARELDIDISLRNVQRFQSGELAIHIAQEHVTPRDKSRRAGVVNVTNVYRRTETGWRMVAHHASQGPQMPDPATELAVHGHDDSTGGQVH